MNYPDKLIQKVIELRDQGLTWREVEAELAKLFPARAHQLPTQRTMREWAQTWSLKEIQDIPIKLDRHFDNLRNFTDALLAGGLDNCIAVNNADETKRYLLNDSSTEISESELAKRIQTNIDNAIILYSKFDIVNCLLTHLEAEPQIKNRGRAYNAIKDAPDEFINVLRVLKRNKNFHGSCEACKEWRKLL